MALGDPGLASFGPESGTNRTGPFPESRGRPLDRMASKLALNRETST